MMIQTKKTISTINKIIAYTFLLNFLFLMISCNQKKEAFSEKKEVVQKLSFDKLLDTVQKTTFNYFWDFAENKSGWARERSQKDAFNGNSRNVITSGGTGLGISSFPTAVTRGWVTRTEALNRLGKILSFIEKVEKFHGAFAHWYLADSAKSRHFSDLDDGGDIVETAFLIQGLLINRQYFSKNNSEEKKIRDRITSIWEAVEWDWYTQNKKSITWHWSPKHNFKMNLPVSGWNEALIVYVLAAASPTHSIDKEVYTNGWARNGKMKNGKTFYNHTLQLGEDNGGPLFLAHYSFLGIDPRGLKDDFCDNYFEQNKAHTLINYEYCKKNPKKYKGYSDTCWGLTASDNYQGYAAHHPNNDLGVITPTAALSSFPYTPKESKKALEFFYYQLHDKLWGKYGFYDAFSEQHNWFSNGYLAIDQAPIVGMIENYRSQQLWQLFMSDHNVKDGLKKLGFNRQKK